MFSPVRVAAVPVNEPRQAPASAGAIQSEVPADAHVEARGHRWSEAQATGSDAQAPIQAVRKTKRQKQERERRLAAVDRLNRGSTGSYDHLDPEVRKGLLALEAAQPAKSASKRNKARRPQLLREANLPSIVEVGAGTGAASAHLRGLSRNRRGDATLPYLATDVSPIGGKGNFLREAQKSGIRARGRVDANRLEEHFPEGSLDEVIGANAYGDKQHPGASYGLVRDTDTVGGTAPDDRFLRSAHKVLKPGGTARLMARSNFLADEHGEFGLAKTNKYLSPTRPALARTPALGYDVDVSSAQQPADVHFYRPDTHPGKQKKLGAYNTEFEFKKRRGPGQLTVEPAPDESDASQDDGSGSEPDERGRNDELDDFLLGQQQRQFNF